MSDALELIIPRATTELVTELFSTDRTVIVEDAHTGELSIRPFSKVADNPRWIVHTREQIAAAAAAALTATITAERAR